MRLKIFLIVLKLALTVSFFLFLLVQVANQAEPKAAQQWEIYLKISPTSIEFPSADPDLQPVIMGNPPVRITISTWPPRREWTLYIRAEGHLISGEGYIIDISNISWRATPQPPFNDGTFVAGMNILLGTGKTDSKGIQEGEITFFFRNSWNYYAGLYRQSVTFTATTP
ncbi:MAG: hypothetical protein N3B16_05450 [Candidatus Aminicenantes bacterium]|nr:hypothetical protein [Candidatus Aminicenantes bacterium]